MSEIDPLPAADENQALRLRCTALETDVDQLRAQVTRLQRELERVHGRRAAVFRPLARPDQP